MRVYKRRAGDGGVCWFPRGTRKRATELRRRRRKVDDQRAWNAVREVLGLDPLYTRRMGR